VCKKFARVHSTSDDKGRKRTSATIAVDHDLYVTVIWDFVESVTEHWHTVDDERFPFAIAGHQGYTLFLPTMDSKIAKRVDMALRSCTFYLGAITADLGNPIHYHALTQCLVDQVYIHHGAVHLFHDDRGEQQVWMENSASFTPRGEVILDATTWESRRPPLSSAYALSKRGKISELRWKSKGDHGVYDRLSAEVYRVASSDTHRRSLRC
jgi:hypothetical protein